MNSIKKILFSLRTTLVLLLIFIVSIAIATFIENDYGADTAKALVYNAWWFQLMLFLLCLNFIGNIFIGKLLRKEKLTTLVFHLAFILILIGAAITHYFGEEGMMHIRKGETVNTISTSDYYLQVRYPEKGNEKTWNHKLLLSSATSNHLNTRLNFGNNEVSISLESFIPDASEELVPDDHGIPTLNLVVAGVNGRETHFLNEGQTINKNGIIISFGDTSQKSGIYIERKADSLTFVSQIPIEIVNMSGQGGPEKLASGETGRFKPMTLYKAGEVTMVMKQYLPVASVKAIPNDHVAKGMNMPDALVIRLKSGNEDKLVTLWGGKGFDGQEQEVRLNGFKLILNFGSIRKIIPFSLHLNKFKLERYPGSNSPKSFQSNITLLDAPGQLVKNDSIYMNNVLQYKGYRFYQSSYDEDEAGTILSVNNDLPGTIVTYAGYFLLFLGLFANLLNPGSRFRWLLRQGSELKQVSKMAVLILLLSSVSKVNLKAESTDSLTVDKGEAIKFGHMLVQDRKGRVEPISTLASEIVRKVSRNNNFKNLTPEQVFLGMNVFPDSWKSIPMIKISHPEIQKLFRTELNLVSFYDCFDRSGNYRLANAVNDAYKKKPSARDKFDTEIIRTDERINICYMVYTGQYLNVFPKNGDPGHTWYSPEEAVKKFHGMDSLFATNIFTMYFDAVGHFPDEKFKKDASTYLESIRNFQKKNGPELILSENRVNLEIWYNRLDIFNRLMKYYGLFGGILLVIQFLSIFFRKLKTRYLELPLIIILFASFVFHTAGLLMRWYLSGHAPWSNGFESLTYIAWATVLAGVLFTRKSKIALSATALLASVILSVAHLTWMDPEITNVVPVLNSYWLSIHVSVISASYGFFALGALLGFLNLLLMFFRNEKNAENLGITITHLSYIAETTLILGLYLVSIGTFLGGVWANESWGRYWGWDPKETWALVTMLVYAFVAHMRFIPALKSAFIFNFSVLISFGSVIMTYFGVNFYLSGLHSYGKGDPLPIPVWIYYTLFVIFSVALMAYLNERKLKKLTAN